jgi:A/G-specific adenine glycosylase
MPWRESRDPYAVWVSEIMLQQTRVTTVVPYFERWMARFPTIEALADAPEVDVLGAWQGLGYYSRARNLQRAARAVVALHGGRLPASVDALRALPGVGPYTAGAIASIAFGIRAALVDGNVIRVLSRLARIDGDPKRGPTQRAVWALADALVPEDAPGDFNQALMELGATVCTPTSPACTRCPLADVCQARHANDVDRYPAKSPRSAPIPSAWWGVVLSNKAGAVLLAQRPPTGLLASLWEPPLVPQRSDSGPSVPDEVALAFPTARGWRAGTAVEHVFSHRIFHVDAWHASTHDGDLAQTPDGYVAWAWHSPASAAARPLSALARKLLASVGPPTASR